MTRISMFLVLLFTLGLLMAQEAAPWQFVRHSAVDAENQVHVRFTGSPTILNEYDFFNWHNNAWTESTLTSDEPLVYEALLPYVQGQDMNYRLRTSYDVAGQTIVSLNPAYLSSNTFPPSLASLAYIADDPVGDYVTANYTNLDITGTWFGYTDTKLFAAMSNNANAFAVMNSFTSYNMYFAGLANSATALTDSTFYGMLYTFNIPGVFSPGLYKFGLNFADTTVAFTRLGDVQAQVLGGKLFLSCNISDLTADPSFGTWPPMFNSLGFTTGTARIDIDLATTAPTFGIGDYSAFTQLIFENYKYQITQNILPIISDVSVTQNGNIGVLNFTYSDANHDFPLYAKVLFDNDTVVDITPTIPDYTQPVSMSAILPTTEWNVGTIRLSDNNIDFVNYTISSTAVEDETTPEVISFDAYPNPYNPANGNLNIVLRSVKNTMVSSKIFNQKGQCVRHLSAQPVKNSVSYSWDGKNDDNNAVANGIYFMQVNQGNQSLSKKIIVIR